MLEQGSLNDVKIKLRDGEIDANKDILIARNDYFATMFSNNKFIEGKTNLVDMSHYSKAVMEKIVKFLFSGTVTFDGLSLAQLLELSHISEMMLLSKFKDKVDDYLKYDIIHDGGKDITFLPLLISGAEIADKFNLSDNRNSIMREVYLNLKDIPNDVASSDSFKNLPPKVIKEIFLHKWRRMPITKHRFKAFMVWLSGNDNANEVTKEDKNEIVDSFNFDDFTVEELLTSVRDSGLYSGTKIDTRVLELFKNQDNLLKETNKLLDDKKRNIRIAKKCLPDKYQYLFGDSD